MVKNQITKAVIPAAGLGTRFLPATKSIPKEMIPIIDVPMIQHNVEEVIRSGIKDVILVTARHKEMIENHFDYNYELDHTLQERGKGDLRKVSRDSAELCNLISVRQKEPLGLGHAILSAEPVIGDEPFAVLLGDDLIDSDIPCTQQLMKIYEKEKISVIGIMEVEPSEVSKYGIVSGQKLANGLIRVEKVVEKPSPANAPSRFAIPGRYILTPSIFKAIRRVKPGKGGEIQLTDALEILAREEGLLAYQFTGTRYDTGDRLGLIDATLAFALKRPELREGVIELMDKHLATSRKRK